MSQQITLRISHPKGRTRINLPENCCLQQLNEEIEKFSKIPVHDQTLSLDSAGNQKILGRPKSELSILGIHNGDMIWVQGTPIEEELKPIPVEQGPATAAQPTPAPPEETPAKPLHETFEKFLQARRYDTGSLAGSMKYSSVIQQKGVLTKIPQSVTLARQPYRHVDHLEFMNVQEIQSFVAHWQHTLHCLQDRRGVMFGYYLEDSNYEGGYRAVVEGIYELPAEATTFDAPAEVAKVVEALGLEQVGVIFTSHKRDYLLSAKETVMAAAVQSKFLTNAHYTGYPVTKQVTCIVQQGGEPEALMVSDQAVAMYRDGLIRLEDQSDDPKRLCIRKPLSAQELLPTVLESYKEVTLFDPDWFLVKLSHGSPLNPRSFFASALFPRENRIDRDPSDILQFWKKNRGQFSDFHFLIFIAEIIDVETAILVATCVRQKKPVPQEVFDLVDAIISGIQ